MESGEKNPLLDAEFYSLYHFFGFILERPAVPKKNLGFICVDVPLILISQYMKFALLYV